MNLEASVNQILEMAKQVIFNEDIKTKRGCTSCSQQNCASRKLPEKATVNTQDGGEEEGSKTTADISGIAMKGQPIQ